MSNGKSASVEQVEHVAGVFEATLIAGIRRGQNFTEVIKMARDYKDVLHDISMDSIERDELDVSAAADEGYNRLTLVTDTHYATISAAHDKEMEKFNTNREES